ncbi:ACT domain-containing protein [Peptoniphilus ivorii]|uniref:ACT domain-containing protein n=1 Tax=Aedoeadaptatus ivorii TaxID=54006 RepID=UPI00277D7203|nr:ACT domain-containing protein [Peptoniphilus ivorii]MDQ0509005.1 ACT domain-containing protein [Peptoniphilus ivorii]
MKAVVSVLGRDQIGIVYRVTEQLQKHKFNILDISQTIVDGYFTMILVVEHADENFALEEVVEEYQSLGEELGLDIRLQHEALFSRMHRI